MLNDVHPPPLEPDFDPARKPTPAAKNGARVDRAHELDRKSDHRSAGVDLIYSEPEDRGDSFNTTMSAIVVAIGLCIIAAIGWTMWR